jgi:hypothetical protein
MKRTILAAALIALPGLAAAQYGAGQQAPQQVPQPQSSPSGSSASAATAAKVSVNIPKADCGDTPTYPGGAAMRAMDDKRKKFEAQLTRFRECMLAYIEQEKALTLGHQDAYKAAVERYNTAMKEINAAQEAAAGR